MRVSVVLERQNAAREPGLSYTVPILFTDTSSFVVLMAAHSIYWHDYETFGINPASDRPSQFAGIRTDEQLNLLGDPLVLYCQPPVDRLPSVEACLITGITPQMARQNGVREAEFITSIHQQLSQPGTCGTGYNSLRFDDEVTRYTLYRNFYDPYAREWQNDCSRWDIIDLARMTYAMRPDGIEWPKSDNGDPSFRLEKLTAANGIAHDSAHDALSDVYATIELGKLILARQPKLFQWLYGLRNKRLVAEQIDIRQAKPLVHTTRMYPAAQGCTSLVLPLVYESGNKNSVLVYDLRFDPAAWLDSSVDELKSCLFTPRAELVEGVQRLPVKSIKINKCPAIAPLSTMGETEAERIQLDMDACNRHRQALLASPDFTDRIAAVFSDRQFAEDWS